VEQLHLRAEVPLRTLPDVAVYTGRSIAMHLNHSYKSASFTRPPAWFANVKFSSVILNNPRGLCHGNYMYFKPKKKKKKKKAVKRAPCTQLMLAVRRKHPHTHSSHVRRTIKLSCGCVYYTKPAFERESTSLPN
jgi:hypothetical protein